MKTLNKLTEFQILILPRFCEHLASGPFSFALTQRALSKAYKPLLWNRSKSMLLNRNVAGKCSREYSRVCAFPSWRRAEKRFGRDLRSRAKEWLRKFPFADHQAIQDRCQVEFFRLMATSKSSKAMIKSTRIPVSTCQHLRTLMACPKLSTRVTSIPKQKLRGLKFQFANWLALYPI